mmetsp:Transcript_19454/g.48657  ORF Transcript_19454/g.48657 Transcript_19454/m.48657 type:complete len:80 (+) Transcript_19454:861-1100(+)
MGESENRRATASKAEAAGSEYHQSLSSYLYSTFHEFLVDLLLSFSVDNVDLLVRRTAKREMKRHGFVFLDNTAVRCTYE